MAFVATMLSGCVYQHDLPLRETDSREETGAYMLVRIGGDSVLTRALSARETTYIANVGLALYDSDTGQHITGAGYTGAASATTWTQAGYFRNTAVPPLWLRISNDDLRAHPRLRLAVVLNMRAGVNGANMFDPTTLHFKSNVTYNYYNQLSAHSLSENVIINNPGTTNNRWDNFLEDMAPMCSVSIDNLELRSGINFLGYTDQEISSLTADQINTALSLSGDEMVNGGTRRTNLNACLDNHDDRLFVQPIYARIQLDNLNYDKKHLYIENAFLLNAKYFARLLQDDCFYPESAASFTSFCHAFRNSWITDLEAWLNSTPAPTTDFLRFNVSKLSKPQTIETVKYYMNTNTIPGGTTSSGNGEYYRTDATHVFKRIVDISNNDFAAFVNSLTTTTYGDGNYNPAEHYPYYPPTVNPATGTAPITSQQKSAYFKLPFFYVWPNDGSDETTTDANGMRNYHNATYLVVRGYWSDSEVTSWGSTSAARARQGHVVYYPILVNGPQKGVTVNYGSTSASEQGTLVRRNRLYRMTVNIRGEGVRNPWESYRNETNMIKVALSIDENWLNGGDQYITLK